MFSTDGTVDDLHIVTNPKKQITSVRVAQDIVTKKSVMGRKFRQF